MNKPQPMNEQNKYLEPGLLEDFCLGLLPEKEAAEIMEAAEKYPALKQQIEELEEGLKSAYSMAPSGTLKQKIFDLIDTADSDDTISLSNLPFISRHSNVAAWQQAVQSIAEPEGAEELKMLPLLDDSKREMYVAWLYNLLEEDGHQTDDFVESFLIIEGSCECNVGGKMLYLQAGDYLEIPPSTRHSILPTTANGGCVKAIVQRKKAA
jgi:mannose-6-phosphate isomerase-like protein (cupin superfamily)